VDSIVFARSVESREPVGAAKEFEASVTQVFCWTKLSAKTLPAAVNHVWYNAGRKLLDVPLTLNYSSGRYWSVKNVSPGDWTVEVVGANGDLKRLLCHHDGAILSSLPVQRLGLAIEQISFDVLSMGKYACAEEEKAYLDEFSFRFNRRISQHLGKLFYRLMQQAVRTRPPPVTALYVSKLQSMVAT
jgi:hypothetical protein